MKIPFVGPTYQSQSKNADQQRSINCYVEMDNNSPRAPVALYGTPGTVSKVTFSTSGYRGSYRQNGYGWFVYGQSAYRLSTDLTVLKLGDLKTGTGRVGITGNGIQLLIVDGAAGYLVDTTTSTLTVITDTDFPNGVTMADYADQYFIVSGDSSGKFYISSLLDGAQWDSTEFASAEGSPDITVGHIVDHLELWLFGQNSIEIWQDTGNADFPFQRTPNAFLEVGCASKWTICKLDNSIFWLGQNDRGAGIIYRVNGYTPVRVSDFGVENAIQRYSTISDAYAFTYQQLGHDFYVITFPTAGVTWVYDVANNLWHERAYYEPDGSGLTQWRCAGHLYFSSMNLCGDYENGNLYSLEPDVNTDNGGILKRVRVTQALEKEQARIIYHKLQIDMETGVSKTGQDASLMLRFSNDGHTWSGIKSAGVGKTGEYGKRVIYRRLGQGRNRLWEISMTDDAKFAVFGANVDVELCRG
jgi:hypothetical protein